MALSKSHLFVVGVTLALSGCSFVDDALFPSLGGEGEEAAVSQGVGYADQVPGGPPVLGSTVYAPLDVTPGQPTGTFVGQKVQTLRGELSQLQTVLRQRSDALQALRVQTEADSRRYHELVGSINSRLQVGTTPGNPVLHQQWAAAQGQLDSITQDVARMNQLATQVASDSAMCAYLLDSVRATYSLSGAVEEDHRQLRILEDETNQTLVLVERVLSELSQDIARQQAYVGNERGNLNTIALGIKNGQLYGTSLANQALIRSAGGTAPMAAMPMAGAANRRPLVVIRFDRPNVAYEQALYQAVSRAIERRPDALFDLVAVSPLSGNAGQQALAATSARRNADQVMRSLTDMGLPGDRVSISATPSPTASASEVHLYVR